MIAYQMVVAPDGYEVCMFPLEYMYITQGEDGQYSHQGTLNIDFQGYGPNGRILECPYYAPCSCECVAGGGVDNWRVFTSLDKVHLADGTLSKVTWVQMHDNNPPSVGSRFLMGSPIGNTGTAGNVTGDHVHLNFALGDYAGWHQVSSGQSELINSMHIYDACYVNDTVLVRDYDYPWRLYTGPTPTPVTGKRTKFPWVLYANKIRTR